MFSPINPFCLTKQSQRSLCLYHSAHSATVELRRVMFTAVVERLQPPSTAPVPLLRPLAPEHSMYTHQKPISNFAVNSHFAARENGESGIWRVYAFGVSNMKHTRGTRPQTDRILCSYKIQHWCGHGLLILLYYTPFSVTLRCCAILYVLINKISAAWRGRRMNAKTGGE